MIRIGDMRKTKININLAPRDEFKATPVGSILDWIINIGRYIVIFTELVVIVAFLIRFKLDRDLAKLHQEIKQNKAIIISYEELEIKARSTQKRLGLINGIKNESPQAFSVIEELSQITPVNVIFSDLDINKNNVSIKGQALSNVGLSSFLNSLTLNKKFSEIYLESVSSKTTKGSVLEFQLKAKFLVGKKKDEV